VGDGEVIMVSSETNPLSKKNELFRKFIPDFFRRRDRCIRLQTIPVNATSYIFTWSGAPVFYCSKAE